MLVFTLDGCWHTLKSPAIRRKIYVSGPSAQHISMSFSENICTLCVIVQRPFVWKTPGCGLLCVYTSRLSFSLPSSFSSSLNLAWLCSMYSGQYNASLHRVKRQWLDGRMPPSKPKIGWSARFESTDYRLSALLNDSGILLTLKQRLTSELLQLRGRDVLGEVVGGRSCAHIGYR